jgi:class 3 adenylate cyclase/tetratricopeptide (TPR) repeat protein
VVRCPGCGEENPAKFRLCGYCGAQLAPRVAAEEVRKTVTIVFCDLKGSTSLGERLDSESLREVLSVYFAEMRQVLERHGGTVEKYIGDAIMAVFGLPRLHEDDALRAVRAAFEMKAALRELNVRIQATWGVTLENRTGVNTGEVVAGDTASGQRLATGDTVNVAARLEQAAPDGEILLGDSTFRLTRDAVLVEPVEPLELKGKSDRVPAYRLLGVSGGEAITRRLDLPIVGRDEPYGRLLMSFGRATGDSRCEVVTVLGQAGIGKSRLIEEFVRHVGDRAQVLRGKCLSYGQGITFWPLAEVVRQAAGIASEDSEDDARAKVWSLAGAEHEDAARRICHFMGMGASDHGRYGKDELLWSARVLMEVLAGRHPLVVIFDDIHWAEPIFLDFIEQVAGTAPQVPLHIICAARHDLLEERPGFLADVGSASSIDLPELSRDDTARVLDNLLGGARLPSSLTDRILLVAGGNPLFIEQMIAMLADSGVIREQDGRREFIGSQDAVPVPQNVSSLLASRLDRLLPLERGIVERAAVIGIDFQPAAIAALAPDTEAETDLAMPLSALCDKRLIRRAQVGLDVEGYRFANMLLRDAAYDRLLKRSRARMHERFADWLVEISADRVAEREEIIGYHLEQSFRYRAELGPVEESARAIGDRAAGHLGAAGSRAFDRGDMHAAASLLQRAVGLLEPGHRDRPRLLLAAGEALGDQGQLTAAEATLDQARTAAALIGNEQVERAAELAQLHLRYVTNAASAQAGVARVQELIEILEATGDSHGLARAWRLMTYVHWTASQSGKAAEAAERAIRYARQAGDETMARQFGGALVTSMLDGPTPVDEAAAYCEAMLPQVADDRRALAVTEQNLAHLEAMRANFDDARVRYRRSRELLEDFGYRFFAALTSLISGPVEMLADDLDAAENELRGDYETLTRLGERNYISTTGGMLAEVLYRQGRYQESAEFARFCQDVASADDVPSQFLWRCVRAKLLARDGQQERADGLIAEATKLISGTDWLVWQGNGFMDLAEVHRLGGRTNETLDALAQARACFLAKGNVVAAKQAADLVGKMSPA